MRVRKTALSRRMVVFVGAAVVAIGVGAGVLLLRPPSAMEVCHKLVIAGVANGCEPKESMAGPGSSEVKFELSGPGSHGIVETHAAEADYREAITRAVEIDELFSEHGQEPHRFQNDHVRVRVMLVHGAAERVQRKAERVVNGL